MSETEQRMPIPADAVYEITVAEDKTCRLRLAAHYTVEFVLQLFGFGVVEALRPGVTIRVVRREDGRVLRAFACDRDDDALAVEHGLRDNLQRLTAEEFLAKHGL